MDVDPQSTDLVGTSIGCICPIELPCISSVITDANADIVRIHSVPGVKCKDGLLRTKIMNLHCPVAARSFQLYTVAKVKYRIGGIWYLTFVIRFVTVAPKFNITRRNSVTGYESSNVTSGIHVSDLLLKPICIDI